MDRAGSSLSSVSALGSTTVASAFVRSLKVACGVRFLLGVCKADLLPGNTYSLSRWYRRSELAFRLLMYTLAAAGIARHAPALDPTKKTESILQSISAGRVDITHS